jgi:hypothetical protein
MLIPLSHGQGHFRVDDMSQDFQSECYDRYSTSLHYRFFKIEESDHFMLHDQPKRMVNCKLMVFTFRFYYLILKVTSFCEETLTDMK